MAALDTALCRQREAEAEEAEDHDMRCLKLARSDPDMVAPEKVAPFFVPSSPHPFFPGGGQMLSFSSSSKEEATMLSLDGTSPCYYHPSASASTHSLLRNAGTLGENMHGVLARIKGPFTPAQWLELERQALIYKYMVANIAIPPSLLISTWRGLGPCRLPPYSAGYFGSSTLGWSQGFSGNEDPEPGRCRRTDGKKWRCSRDAVADQKYCERHMNRGRHRSRKHVEGRNGHAAKVMPAVAPSQSASTVSTGGISCNVTKSLHRAESFQTTDHYHGQVDRTKAGEGSRKECTQDSEGHCMLGSSNLIPTSNLLPAPKEHTPLEEASSGVELGLVSTNFPLKPPISSLSDNISYVDTSKINCQQSEPCHLQNFIDEFPKNQFARSNIPWSGIGEIQSHRTQLSISVPMACSDFVSTSFTSDDLANSPFKLSQGYNTVDMGLGVGLSNEASKCQTGWIPISWESSVAGPLGEVLNNTSVTPNEQCKNFFSSSINFLADGCDLNKWVVSSSTGVLHKTSLGSVSSSTGSSPRVENRNASLCDGILGSTLVNLPTIPS